VEIFPKILQSDLSSLGSFFQGTKEKILYGFFENYHSENTKKKLAYDLMQFVEFLCVHFSKLDLLNVDHDHIIAF
jgi:hypothetical protein